MFGLDPQQLVFLILVAFAAGTAVLAIVLPFLGSAGEARVKAVAVGGRGSQPKKQTNLGRLLDGQKDNRRRQVQESLKQIEEQAKQQKRGVPLRLLISRAGLNISTRKFWIISGLVGVMMALLPVLFGFPLLIGLLGAVVGCLGLPRWFLGSLAKRRQKAFLEALPDAVDVMVRGLKAGLPLSDAMRVIAAESEPPVGPEFTQVVEGQRLGITIEQGLERMFERVPLAEVSFLGIVVSIQAKAGGNLSEALGNLSKVLRDRKKLKAKVRSMSQEAKSSAAIIGVLPFMIVGALLFISPGYLDPLLTSRTGHMVLAGCGAWMLAGILIMRSMINFDI